MPMPVHFTFFLYLSFCLSLFSLFVVLPCVPSIQSCLSALLTGHSNFTECGGGGDSTFLWRRCVDIRRQLDTGDAALGAGINDGGATDLVVMDDFIFREPMAVPEPSTFGMFGLASLLLLRRRFRNQKAIIFCSTRPAEFQN